MMKSIVKGITTLGLFCVSILYGYSLNAQNLVSNGGLETWTVTNIPDGWDKYEEISEETTQVFEGASSAKHAAGTSDLAQVISVTGGEEYTISYYVYDNDADARSRIWSYWRTDGSNITDVNEGLRPTTYSSDADSWQQVSMTLTAPVDANELFFEVRTYNDNGASDTGFIYYDSFSVEATSSGPSIQFTNLEEAQEIAIGNYDFEFSFTDYELTSDGTPFPEIIRLYIDDVLTESVTTITPMSVEFTEAGAHTARVELINLVTSGEEPLMTSGNINFTVAAEVIPPTLTVTGITEDEVLVTDEFSFGTDITNFSVAAPSDGDGYIIYYIDADDNTDIFDADASTNVSGLANGAHTLTVSLVDNSGNPLAPEVTETISFTVDVPVVLAPGLAITGITDGETFDTDATSFGTTVTDFTVAAPSDGDGYIEYSLDGGSFLDLFDADATTDLTSLSNGAHSLTVQLVDNSGNVLDPEVSQTVNFSVNTGDIFITFDAPTEGDDVAPGDIDFQFTVNNYDFGGPTPFPDVITLFIDDELITTVNAGSTISANVTDLGAHTATLTLTNLVTGDFDPPVTTTINFTVSDEVVLDPVISFVTPENDSEHGPGFIDFEYLLENYTLADNDVVEIYFDDELGGSTSDSNTISAEITELGSHTAMFRLTNTVNGDFDPPVEAMISFSIVEEDLDPAISFVSPLEGAELDAGTIDFEFLIENFDFGGDFPSPDIVELYIDDELVTSVNDGNMISASVTAAGAHTATIVITNLVTGNYDPSIEATINFTTNVSPVLSVVAPTEGADLLPGSIDFQYLLEDYTLGVNDVVELYIDDAFVASTNDSDTFTTDVTETGAHTAMFVLSNTVTGDFTPAVEASVNFTITAPLVDQTIDLSNGWSIFSMNVTPVDPDISVIMAPIVDDIFIVKDQIGNVFWPDFAVNSIGDVDPLYGFQAKATAETSFTVTGVAIDPTTEIPVTEGWNIIGYLPNYDLDAAEAMSSISADVVILKDENGEVYWPAFGINNIGTMTAGEGYQIKMFVDNNLSYPEESSGKYAAPVKAEFAHFSKTANTGRNMTIGIPASAWPTTPEFGDELAVLDAAGNVTGSAIYYGSNTAITVWGDDEVTTSKDGLLDGEQIRLKYWNKADNKEWFMDVEWVEGDNYYVSDGIHIAGTISLREASTDAISLLANMPNPFNETTNLRFYTDNNEPIKVQVYNALGALVLEDVITIDVVGYNEYTIDARDMNSGTYFYHLSNNEFTTTGKMSLIK